MRALLVAGLVAVAGSGGAQQTEAIGRIELANGYLSIDARSDGMLVLSAVNALRFGVASGSFSIRTVEAWLGAVSLEADSMPHRPSGMFGQSPVLLGADGATRFAISFRLTPSPSLVAAVFARSDGVQVQLNGGVHDSSFTKLISALHEASSRSTALTLASPDSARLHWSDARLSGRIVVRPAAAPIQKSNWRTADRLFVTAASAALAGVGGSYARHAATCPGDINYCSWRMTNPGYAAGSVIGASLMGMAFTRTGRCGVVSRLARSVGTAAVAAAPGAILATSGKQVSLAVIPAVQALAMDFSLRDCRRD